MKRFLISISCLIILLNFQEIYSQDATATGISRAFNPAISVNGLFAGMASTQSKPLWPEIGLKPRFQYQEVSLELTSNVDIYLQSKFVFCTTEEEGMAVEEAYVTTLRLPVVIRAGAMLNSFGQQNLCHLHHLPFAEPSMISKQVFGDGLCETSIEAAYMFPVPWYCDLTAGVLNGNNSYLFNSSRSGDIAYLIHLDNLWDMSDEIAVRAGGSFLTGQTEREVFHSKAVNPLLTCFSSQTMGVDLQLKWKPLQYGRYRSFILQGEYIQSVIDETNTTAKPLRGYFVQALRQFNLRWWLQARYDWFERPAGLGAFFPEPGFPSLDRWSDVTGKRLSAALAYVPTEFSAYRLQYNYMDINGELEQQVILQMNITIGSHPAHKY